MDCFVVDSCLTRKKWIVNVSKRMIVKRHSLLWNDKDLGQDVVAFDWKRKKKRCIIPLFKTRSHLNVLVTENVHELFRCKNMKISYCNISAFFNYFTTSLKSLQLLLRFRYVWRTFWTLTKFWRLIVDFTNFRCLIDRNSPNQANNLEHRLLVICQIVLQDYLLSKYQL